MTPAPLHLLCIEPRFPGRLGPVADWLVRRRGYRCQFYFHTAEPREHWPESVGRGLELVHFNVGGVAREAIVPWTRQLERALCYAYGCCEVIDMKRPRPVDVVLGRSAGLGSTLFVPASLPRTPIINLFDYFYQPHRYDLAEEAAPDTPVEYFHWRRTASAMDLLELENGVTPWTPTRWQRDLFPPEYRNDFSVLFDGVDARRFARRSPTERRIAGRVLPRDMRVVTFVSRSLDRLRGFDRFLELGNRLLRARKDVLCVVVGDPVVQRGLDVHFYGKDYRAHLLQQCPLHDAERVWFLDAATPDVVAEALLASDLYVYPSRPYSLARSLIEAMAASCPILAWDEEPVREFVEHGRNGLLVQDIDAAERWARQVLDDPPGHAALGAVGAETVREQYDQDVTLPRLEAILGRIMNNEASPKRL